MTAAEKRVLGVDFGTTNTYFSICPCDELLPQGVDFEGRGRDGLSTAVLYRNDEIFLIGDKAIEEFSDASSEERRSFSLMMQFKPDISKSEKAKKAAVDFLSSVIRYSEKTGIFIAPEEMKVVFGVPSDASEGFKTVLREVVRKAGYGETELLDESTAALIHHVAQREIPASTIFSPGLVIDFGGGTCDFTIMDNGEDKYSWGDFYLGGRLFDDLFFQWFLDQNPSAGKRLKRDRSEEFFLFSICKDAKEYFSRTMERNRSEVVHKRMWEYGRLEDITWDIFLKRAKSYRPSDVLLDFWLKAGMSLPELFRSDKSIDLIEWFRSKLKEGLEKDGIDKKDLRYLILTGGSSQWPFVKDIVGKELGHIGIHIVRSTRPYAAVAKGLSVLFALKNRFVKIKDKIEKNRPEFIENEIEPYMIEYMDKTAGNISREIVMELFDKRIRPVITEFRQSKGDLSLKDLEGRIVRQAENFAPIAERIVKEKVEIFSRVLLDDVVEKTRAWLEEYRMDVDKERVGEREGIETGNWTILDLPDPVEDYLWFGSLITSAVSGVLASVVCGGSGVALVASGPLGIVVGAVAGGVAGLMAARYGADRLKEVALHRWLRKLILSDKVILSMREKFYEEFKNRLNEQLNGVKGGLRQDLEKIVDAQIKALSYICQL
ncbi:MAG: hypothetical protein J7J52_02315 [Deltaproteobacteria bacterium]|nr:hypothetical protein [Deltaproteobacteria bacterium]